MASYTIFSQADPFPHNEYFLELLKHPATLGKVQTMSRLYLSEGEFETPKAAGIGSLHQNVMPKSAFGQMLEVMNKSHLILQEEMRCFKGLSKKQETTFLSSLGGPFFMLPMLCCLSLVKVTDYFVQSMQ